MFVILSEHDPELREGRASRRIYAFDLSTIALSAGASTTLSFAKGGRVEGSMHLILRTIAHLSS
jgi:hypothetical protein